MPRSVYSLLLALALTAACSDPAPGPAPTPDDAGDGPAPTPYDAGAPAHDAGEDAGAALSVRFAWPHEGTVLADTVTLRVLIRGEVVRKVRYLVDGQLLAEYGSAVETLDWNTCFADDGPHTLRVEVEDESWRGNSAFDERVVSVRNADAAPVLRGRSAGGASRLDWSFCGAPEGFEVFWQTAPAVSTSSARLRTSERYLVHREVPEGATSYYRVAARTANGLGALSNEVALAPGTANARLCSRDGWCWDRGAEQGEVVSALWAHSDDEVVAFGTPTSMHWDGLDWRPLGNVISYYAVPVRHVWGSAPDDIWLMEPQPQHWDGRSWKGVDLPIGGASALWGTAANDVWAAGSGNLAHWNGSGWTSTYHAELDAYHVSDLWADDAGGVWISVFGLGGAVFHYDGAAMRKVLTVEEETTALWGSGPDDVWVVGQHGTMHHWDGTTWTSSRHGIEHFHDVHGCGPDAAWAVGDFGLVMHYDGVRWQREDVGTRVNLSSVVCSGKRTWVGGERGELLSRTRETGWSAPRTELMGPLRGFTNGPDGPLVVGEYETVLTRDAVAWQRQGGTLERQHPNLDLRDMHGTAIDDLWAVGAKGAVLHSNGSGWEPMEPVTSYDLRAVWANGPADVWAAGYHGALIHYDGSGWTPVSAGSSVVFDDLWGSGPNDVWAAGWDGISHWDGASWRAVPDDDSLYQSVDHLWGSGPDDVWATTRDQLLRWDGSRFRKVDVGFRTESLGTVHGTGPNDVWIFQDEWFARFDGTAWLRTEWGSDFNPSFGQVTPTGTVWLLGRNRTRYGDGTTWTPAPVTHIRGANTLFALDDEHVYTAGDYGTIQRWDGADWVVESPTPANPQHYGDVWIESAESMWVVGDYGTIRRVRDGVWEEHQSGTLAQLFAVTGSGPNDVWAGGEAGTLVHYDGAAWTVLETGLDFPINDLLTLPSGDVIAVAGDYGLGGQVNYNGTVLRYDGQAWHDEGAPNVPGLAAVWAAADHDIWAVGESGTTLHFDGAAWVEIGTPLGFADTLLGVWGRDSERVWAVGSNGAILYWNGGTWQRQSAPTRLPLLEVGGNDEAIWAVGGNGTILRRPLD